MSEKKNVRTSLIIPVALYKKLKALAKKRDVSQGYLIRQAIEKYLKDEHNSI